MWIQTKTGIHFDFDNPTVDMICLEDIAHALSNTCRFSGHCSPFYSIAQHSVLVAQIIQANTASRDTVCWALLHDAAEAYIGDIVTPLKHTLALHTDYIIKLESTILQLIGEKFKLYKDVDWFYIDSIDKSIVMTEAELFLGSTADWERPHNSYMTTITSISPLDPVSARGEFLNMAENLGIKEVI